MTTVAERLRRLGRESARNLLRARLAAPSPLPAIEAIGRQAELMSRVMRDGRDSLSQAESAELAGLLKGVA